MERLEMITYLKAKRDEYVNAFSSLESDGQFQREAWNYQPRQGGFARGGGEISVLRGEVFEKAAVNWSGVEGEKLPESSVSANENGISGRFFATGVSLITHMRNPKAPTVHFNVRYLEAGNKRWLGGGFDLTPMGFPYEEDTQHFHAVAKKALSGFPGLYEKFSQQAKEYFTIQHYQRERGVGGIFFDQYFTGRWEEDVKMWQSVADHFLAAIMPIYEKRIHEPFTPKDRQVQLEKRAHYVEFNLLYDRGTRFGFQSGGNPKAILCSMPPLAAW